MKWRNPSRRAAVFAALVSWSFAAPLPAPSSPGKDPDKAAGRDVGSGINFYSLEKEIALGRELAKEVEQQARLVDDPIAAEYLNRLVQNLGRNSDVRVPLTAKLIESSEVNAFALPGGFLFVNSGLMLKATTEAELAGPLAHEVAHVAARHGTRQASRGQLANWASLPLIFLGGVPGLAARQGAALALPMTFLKFSRSFEQEADGLAVQYMARAGYDPVAFIDFFEKIAADEKSKPGTISELFRSHPTIESRIQWTQKRMQELHAGQPAYVVTTSEFDLVRQGLAAAANRRQAEPARTGPTLRRTGQPQPDTDDERPTLKRGRQ